MGKRTFLAVGMTAVLALGAAGCGDSNDSSSSGGGGGAAAADTTSAGPKLKGAPFKLGAPGSYSGPQQASTGQMDDTLKAWVKYKNDNGGIAGHPVQIDVQNDNNNAGNANRIVRKMVEQDKVQAIIASSLVDTAWEKYAAQKKFPVIGAVNFDTPYSTNPYFFATGAQVPALVYGLLTEAKKAGLKNIGMLPCAETTVCAQFAKLFQGIGAKVVKIGVPFVQKITATQPNYTSTCLAAKKKKVDGLIILENAETVVRVADQCAQQGYKPKQLNLTGAVGQVWTKSPNLEGATATQMNVTLPDESIPATKAFHAALDKYGPGIEKSDQYNELDVSAWAAAEAFALAAEKGKLTPTSTPADVVKAMRTFKNETVGGLAPPLTYPPGKPAFVTCWFSEKVQDGKFVSINGAKPTCIKPADIPVLAKVLGG